MTLITAARGGIVKRVVLMAVALLVAACAAPAPSAPVSTSVKSATPAVPSGQPAAGPTDLVVSGTGATVRFNGWTATCSGVAADDCQGVAALFANNLARSWKAAFDASRGRIVVQARTACPASLPDWADAASCWQATAPAATGDVCMVIARHPAAEGAVPTFGQVGGDDMTGRAGGPPSGWPVCD